MNEHESAARTAKAIHLADVLQKAGVTASEAINLNPELWDQAVEVANAAFGTHHQLPSPATKAMVVALLEDRERLADSDPLAGLPAADQRPMVLR